MTGALRAGRLAAAVLTCVWCAVPVAWAQEADASADPAAVRIDGPPAPVAPDVIARGSDGKATMRATRLTEPLRVDGRLDEPFYESVPPIGGFIQMEPNHGAPATEQTEVWIFFDADTLYVAARCYDSQPEDRWVANEMRRDSMNVVRNENFAIYFDTFYDRRNAYLFEISPIGGIYDAHVTNERPGGNIDWNPVWDRQAGRFANGWTAEMSIPFKSLRYRPGRSQVWGINIRRTVRWKNEESFVLPMPATSGSAIFQISRGGTLVGLEAPSGSRNLEIKPYAISSLTTDRLANPPLDNDADPDAGFDVKYGVTQNLTADFTYNTDFAQVEVDEQQVNLTRFNLFFPEKREFFLEGQGIFEFGGTGGGGGGGGGLTPTLFYSRRIGLSGSRSVPIDAGGRLTGKIGAFTLGVLNVQTDAQPAPLAGGAAVPATNFSVVRLRRDILRRSSIGALVTNRSIAVGGGGASQTYGVDAALGFFDYLNVNAYVARTDTPGVEGDDLSYRTQLNYNGDRYGVQLERLMVGDHFNPEVGFLRRDDFARTYGMFRFSPRPGRSQRVRKYSWQTSLDLLSDTTGRLETRDAGTNLGIEFQNSDSFSASFTNSYEFLDDPFRIAPGVTIPVGDYSFNGGTVGYSFGNQRRVSGSVSAEHGGFYDGRRTAVGYRGARIELTPRLSAEPSFSINRITLPAGSFTTTLVANRATFTVTPRMFFSALVQYNSSNTTVGSNIRFRWEYHPGSELFVVYTDERDTALRGAPALENRAFVVKINRLVRF